MLRNIFISDAERIAIINSEELGYDMPVAYTRERIGQLLTDSHHYFLVYEDPKTHQAIGYIHGEVYQTLYFDPVFNVLALAVSKQYQHQRIGKQLVQGLEVEAKRRGFAGIRLNSGGDRTKAHEFYKYLGFVDTKDQKRFLKSFSQNN